MVDIYIVKLLLSCNLWPKKILQFWTESKNGPGNLEIHDLARFRP